MGDATALGVAPDCPRAAGVTRAGRGGAAAEGLGGGGVGHGGTVAGGATLWVESSLRVREVACSNGFEVAWGVSNSSEDQGPALTERAREYSGQITKEIGSQITRCREQGITSTPQVMAAILAPLIAAIARLKDRIDEIEAADT